MARRNVIGGGSARQRRIDRRRQIAADALAEVERETDADEASAAFEHERVLFSRPAMAVGYPASFRTAKRRRGSPLR